MTSKPPDPEIQRAAAAIQLTVAIAETLRPAELGNELYQLMVDTWIRHGRSPEWIDEAVDAIDDIWHIAFSKNAEQKWVLVVEWRAE
jgi:hypothetical protein